MALARHTSWTAAAFALSLTLAACSSDDGKPTGSSGTSAGTDAGSEPAAEGGGAKAGLGQPCTKPEECESNVCFLGGTQSFCTLTCTPQDAATVCKAPLTGTCNKQGLCKRD